MLIALIVVAVALGVGGVLRTHVAPMRRLHLPSSVIAGALLLAVFEGLRGLGMDTAGDVHSQLASWPGVLIAVVFACMLLPGADPDRTTAGSLSAAAREGLMVWVIVLGQTALGLTLVWLWLGPKLDVPAAFGTLIETGFAGGHGTAAAMGGVFESISPPLASGLDLGIAMATVGLMAGIIAGVGWVNYGIAAGWTQRSPGVSSSIDEAEPANVASPTIHPSPRWADLDPWVVQLIWIAAATGVGLALQATVGIVGRGLDSAPDPSDPLGSRTNISAVLGSFPLFIYTLGGGWIVGQAVRRRDPRWIEATMIQRWSNIAMDGLVVAAIATLNIHGIRGMLGGLAILMVAGLVWCSLCLVVLGRMILPTRHWFELGLINFGMSTGTTATGFVLLRMVDPSLRTDAARDYALAAPISSPFVGGGMLTIAMPLVILPLAPLAWICVTLWLIVFALVMAGVLWKRRVDHG